MVLLIKHGTIMCQQHRVTSVVIFGIATPLLKYHLIRMPIRFHITQSPRVTLPLLVISARVNSCSILTVDIQRVVLGLITP